MEYDTNKPEDGTLDEMTHASSLLTQIALAMMIGGTAFLLFCILRSRWPQVYAPRTRLIAAAPARMGKTLFGWMAMTVDTGDYDIMYSTGLDSILVLRLFKMLCALSVAGAIVGVVLVVPLKVVLSSANSGDSVWDRYIAAAMGTTDPLVVHFVGAYVVTAIVYFYFVRFVYQAVALRWQYLLRVRNTRPARSIMVTGIPSELATEKALKNHFKIIGGNTNSGNSSVVSAEIVPRISKFAWVVKRRSRLIELVEEVLAEVLGNPCPAPGYARESLRGMLNASNEAEAREMAVSRVREWALPYWQRRPKRLDWRIRKLHALLDEFCRVSTTVERVRHEWFAEYDGKRSDRSSSVGFVTFADAQSAHLAAQTFTYSEPFRLRAQLAPEARDVYWENVTLPLGVRAVRGSMVLVGFVLMVLYWSVMAASVTSLVSLESLEKWIPGLVDIARKNKWLDGMFRYSVPSLILTLLNLSVPYILNWMGTLAGIQSRSEIQTATTQRYFLFLVATVVLTPTVTGTVLRDYEKWIQDPAMIPRLFARNLPKVAPFFMDYIILIGLGYYPIQLLQFGSILGAALRRMFCRTPRQFADALRPNYIDWAFILPQPMLVFVISTTYSTLAPFVFIFAAVYYAIAYVVTKYLIYYVYSRQFETAGLVVIPVLKMLAASLWHYYIFVIGLCALKGAFGYVLMLLPLLIANAYLVAFVSKQFYDDGKYVPLDIWQHKSYPGRYSNDDPANDEDQISDRFVYAESAVELANQQHTSSDELAASHPSQSTDYLLPRVSIPSAFSVALDTVESENLGVVARIFDAVGKSLCVAFDKVVGKMYIDPRKMPQVFHDLDRRYSINYRDQERGDQEHHCGNDNGSTSMLVPNHSHAHSLGISPRFSTTFDEDPCMHGPQMRAELMIGQDLRETKVEPDEYTDFEQSPITLLEGVLDSGLAMYEHPLLVGELPGFWPPMKKQW